MNSLEALEEFLVDNPELEQLEDMLQEFNIFEVLGIEKREVRHSAFLAWLLDSNGTHGLGDYFLRRFLWRVTTYARTHEIAAITAFDVDRWKLRDVTVATERHRIDILLTSQEDEFVCAIENKVSSGEHGNQLERYRHVVERQYQGLTPLFVLLSIEGEPPIGETDAAHYIPMSYLQIAELIQHVLTSRASSLGEDVQGILRQYVTSLRRHVLADSDIQQKARQIYYNHRKAIDLIIEALPDVQRQMRDDIEFVMQKFPQVQMDHSSKSYIRYVPPEWDQVPELLESEGWTQSGRMLLFEFRNANTLNLHLVLGPGPDHIRQRVLNLAKGEKDLFNNTPNKPTRKWTSLYRKQILNARDYEDPESEAVREKITQSITQFLSKEFKPIVEKVQAEFLENREVW
jgi:hypothetical protein